MVTLFFANINYYKRNDLFYFSKTYIYFLIKDGMDLAGVYLMNKFLFELFKAISTFIQNTDSASQECAS